MTPRLRLPPPRTRPNPSSPSAPRLRRRLLGGLALTAVLAPTLPAPATAAQGPNFVLAPSEIERRLADDPFEIVGIQDNRWEGDRTQRAALRFRDGTVLRVKWGRAARGGGALNNEPRYEVAAYVLQKLFLDEPDWVVPPTVMRALPLRVYRQLDPEVAPTFEGTRSVLVALQYWLEAVEALAEPELERVAGDDAYARRLGHLNILTYLIHHVDSNRGNVLISTRGEPRMFAVDNGVAFRSPESPRGTVWKELHLRRLPAEAVRRVRALTRDRLHRTLGVVAQFRVREDGGLEPVEPTTRLNPNRGALLQDGVVQLGLTDLELEGLWARRAALLERVDAGEIILF